VNAVALSAKGEFLAVGADVLYVYTRNGVINWFGPVALACPGAKVRRVAISDSGEWIVAASSSGYLSLFHNDPTTTPPITGPTSFRLPNPTGKQPYVQNIAIAGDGSYIAAAGSDGVLYYFDRPSFPSTAPPSWTLALAGTSACRAVAISQDGSLVAAAASTGVGGTKRHATGGGKVFLFDKSGTMRWGAPAATDFGPNSVSITADGSYVTASDGAHGDKKPGNFYLFDGSDGTKLWAVGTKAENMTMQIAASTVGTTGAAAKKRAAVGGSDDGNVYYFSVP
jgi:WD40 repeat protein